MSLLETAKKAGLINLIIMLLLELDIKQVEISRLLKVPKQTVSDVKKRSEK